jgi:hypothetical protein
MSNLGHGVNYLELLDVYRYPSGKLLSLSAEVTAIICSDQGFCQNKRREAGQIFNPFLRPSLVGQAWDSGSAARSLNCTAAVCGGQNTLRGTSFYFTTTKVEAHE